MVIGDCIKVFLPGESPWAEVIQISEDMVKAKIVNTLFHEHTKEQQAEFTSDNFDTAEPLPRLHNFKQGEEIWFERGEFGEWVPVANQAVN